MNALIALAMLIVAVYVAGLVALVIMAAVDRRERRRIRTTYQHRRAVDLEAPITYWPESPTQVSTESFRDYYNY